MSRIDADWRSDSESDALGAARPQARRLSATVASAGAVGNILEWYDFGLYGLFAPVLARLFFPAQDHFAALVGVYAGFAVGFVMRPIGGAVLGHFGDLFGRRFVLIASIVMMGVTTAGIGLLPSYQAVGLGAPLLLLVLRVLQGFSVGGEFTGSVAFLVESAPQHRRGLAGSIANIGSTGGILLAAGIAAAALTFASHAALYSWAWRLPFLFGGVIAVCGLLLRNRLQVESAPPKDKPADRPLPLRRAIREAPHVMLWATLFTAGYGVVDYLSMVFLPTYAHEFGKITESHALQINTAAQAVALVVVPLAGWLSDHALGRRSLLIIIFLVECVVAWGAFALTRGGLSGFFVAQIGFGFLLALIMGAAPAMLAEQFAGDYRLSAYSVSFNIGIGIGGGTAPMIATLLIAATGDPAAPAFYLMLAGAIAAAAAFMLSDGSRAALR